MKREVMPARPRTLERAAVAAGMLALAACATEAGAHLVVTPAGPEGWEAQVQEAADLWNEALVQCAPIALDVGALPVVLINADEWVEADNVRGYYTDIGIGIRETTPVIERATLVHELGHALGLLHSEDRGSVMWPIVGLNYIPTAEDTALVADRIGCKL